MTLTCVCGRPFSEGIIRATPLERFLITARGKPWTLDSLFAISMEDITIYTASSIPGAASHPTLNCLQWTGDGQLLFSTKSSVYILVSLVNDAHYRHLE